MNFNLKNTTIYKTVKLARMFPPRLIKTINWLLLVVVFILFLAIFGDDFFLSFLSLTEALGLLLIILAFDIFGWIWLVFFQNILKENRSIDILKEQKNLAEHLSFDIALAINKATSYCKRKKISLTVPHVILSLFDNEQVKRTFEKLTLSEKDIKGGLSIIEDNQTPEENFAQVIEESVKLAKENFHQRIEIRDFLVAAAEYNEEFRKILFDNDLDSADLNHVIGWDDFITYEAKWKKSFWKLDNLLKKPGIGKKWAAGYSINVDKYAIDVTKLIKEKEMALHVVGRKREIEMIERILLRRDENNVLVVGKPGGGRSTIVYSLAEKILEGRSVPALNYKRVLELDIQALFAGTKTPGEALERFKIVFSEAANAGNIILIVDNIHTYIGKQSGIGSFDVSSAIMPYLNSPGLQIIGISTFDGFHKYIETNSTIMNFFEKVEIEDPSKEESLFILEDLLPKFEKDYGLKVSYKSLRTIIELTDRYIQDIPFPEKAINFLEEAMVYVKTKLGEKTLLPEHVAEILSQRTKIPVGEIQKSEKEKLLNLEGFIHQRVVNQEEGVKALADAMRRTRANVSKKEKPFGTFLFLGPTGVGKTETCKALAESYFGAETRMIRMDMSEYQSTESINRFIGSPDGKEPGQLTNAIREHPFSLILLDEIEKAHPKILNLFLQVLDEGRLTDSLGRTVSFCNSIIVGTSNAGSEFIREHVENKKEKDNYTIFTKKLTDYLLKKGIFRPEFLNRFDATLVFKPLTPENLIDIAILMLKRLSRRLAEGSGIRFVVTRELAKKVAELGYRPEFGARPMNRVIQDRIESQIAIKILNGELKKGSVIELEPDEI